MRSTPSILVAAVLLTVSLPSIPLGAHEDEATETDTLTLETCRLDGVEEDLRCGTYSVFEDRAAGSGRKIPLRVVVMPATSGQALPDPIVFFAGGPGGSTVGMAQGLAFSMATAREKRDLLLVDYRGTGESAPLFCAYQKEEQGIEEALNTFLPIDQLAACRDALSKKANLRLYTTTNIVDDVEEVRRALGYGKVNLMGGSYGTRAALVYLRRHPESVRTVSIEGVATVDGAIPASFARDAQTALDLLFAECAEDKACSAAFPHPAADLGTVLERLRKKPAAVEITVPESGDKRTMTLTEPAVIQTIRYLQYQALQSLQIPAFLRAAADGDFAPLAQAAYIVALNIMVAIPDGLYLSVTCAEDIPFIDTQMAVRDAENTYMGTFRLRAQQEACAQWVRGDIPKDFRQPISSDVPVLIVSGERDPVTPPRWGAAAAAHLPNSRHLVIADGAHGSFGLRGIECIDQLNARFVDQAGFDGLDLEACLAGIERPSFLLSAARPEAIELSAEALARFPGTYVSPDGAFSTTVSLQDGKLRVRIFTEDLALIPIGPLRFTVEGAPPGTFLDFAEAGGRVVSAEIYQAGSPMATLSRKEP